MVVTSRCTAPMPSFSSGSSGGCTTAGNRRKFTFGCLSFTDSHVHNRNPSILQRRLIRHKEKGGIKEFKRFYPNLCENKKDLTMPLTSSHPPSFLLPCSLPPLSPSIVSTPNCGRDRFEVPPTKILPYLYIGNEKDSCNVKLLRELGIGYILSVTNPPLSSSTTTSSQSQSSSPFSSNNNNHLHHPGSNNDQSEFRKMQIPVSDNLCENLAPYFDAAYEFIEKAKESGSSCLIHCQAGISRSPTIAISYIMKKINLSTLEAYAFVQRERRIISPNLNFMGQLVEFETKMKQGTMSSSSSSCSSENESSMEMESVSSLEESCESTKTNCSNNVFISSSTSSDCSSNVSSSTSSSSGNLHHRSNMMNNHYNCHSSSISSSSSGISSSSANEITNGRSSCNDNSSRTNSTPMIFAD